MTTINKTQTDFLGNEYSYDKNNQINSINTDFNRQIDSAKSVNSSSIQNVLASFFSAFVLSLFLLSWGRAVIRNITHHFHVDVVFMIIVSGN